MGLAGMVAKRGQIEELPQFSGKEPKGCGDACPFMAHPLTRRLSEQLAFLFLFLKCVQLHNGFTRTALGLVEAKCGATHAHNETTSSPDLSCLMTNIHNSSCLAPSLSIPRISGFHVLYTRTRVSIRHVCRFYQMCCSPSASLVKVLPTTTQHNSSAAPWQSVTQSYSVFVSSIPACRWTTSVPPYLIVNHLLNFSIIASFRPLSDASRKRGRAQPSSDDRGCVSWAPMGGSTVP